MPYKGVIQITTDAGIKNLCLESLSNANWWPVTSVCLHLGYDGRSTSSTGVSVPSNAKEATFSGSIKCSSGQLVSNWCSISFSPNHSCFWLANMNCKFFGVEYSKKEAPMQRLTTVETMAYQS